MMSSLHVGETQRNHREIQPFYANNSFCFIESIWLLITRLKALEELDDNGERINLRKPDYNEGCTGCSGHADCFILNNTCELCIRFLSSSFIHSQILNEQVSNLVMHWYKES